jgi:tetratricopeptide (TPR) repeat protein
LQKGAALGLNGAPDSVRFAKYRLGLLLVHNAQFDRASTLLIPEDEGNSLARPIQFALGLALLHKKLFSEEVPGPEIPLVQCAGEVSVLLHGSKYDAAFPLLLQLIKSYPAAPMLQYVNGVALASLSRYDDAEAQFTEELRTSPRSELPYAQRAFVELQVAAPLRRSFPPSAPVQLAPNSAEAHYVLGRSLLDSGKLEDAVKELHAAAQLNPASPEVHFNLAKVYAKLHRREDAERERSLFAALNAESRKTTQPTVQSGLRRCPHRFRALPGDSPAAFAIPCASALACISISHQTAPRTKQHDSPQRRRRHSGCGTHLPGHLKSRSFRPIFYALACRSLFGLDPLRAKKRM